jgi:endoglucanase
MFTRSLKRAVSAAAASVWLLNIAAPLGVMAGQQLGQTDFDNGVGLPWHICESRTAEMEFDISDGKYKITIVNPGGQSNGGEDRWDCQFRHRGLKIVSGHQYKVSYEITPSKSGKYYTKIGNLDGDVEVWHNMSNGYDLDGTWDPIPISAKETKKVELTFTANQNLDVAEWAFHLGGDGQYTQGGCFPAGTEITFDNMSLIDLTSDENDYQFPEEWVRADILTNQVGYFEKREKKATLLCTDKKDISFEVIDDSGKTVYEGKSEYFGYDEDSEDTVHIIDFSELEESGTFHIEADNGAVSRDFKVFAADEVSDYSALLYDSLNYFYQNRSGIEITSEYISSGDKSDLARAAGHTSDDAEIQHTWGYSATSGRVDVTGGWYDAGDHGKYTVNGGLSLWMLQNLYEFFVYTGNEEIFADGSMIIPESGNSYPDLLDEARWEMEWMLKMQLDSSEYEGMAYHKAHDETWTGLGVAPADDDKNRIIKPPTTAATLNLAACAAQSARLWEDLDSDFADTCLEAAEKAYEAAKKHPSMYAPLDESVGGGAYGDDDVTDEFYWAAMELYATTGEKDYLKDAEKSDYYMAVPVTMGSGESVDSAGTFDWGNTAALGTFTALLNENRFDDADEAEKSLKNAADHYIELEEKQGYGLPYAQSTISYNDSDKGYLWGSNSFVADNAIVLAYAAVLNEDDSYTDGALQGLDYLLGRNAMDYSYVTGYGSHTTENPHHRWWSNQIDDKFPKAPCGVLSGGPNSGMQDPWVKGMGWKKGEIAPQKCYVDSIEAWSCNECTINWNASLAWLTAFSALNADIKPGEGGTDIGIENDGGDAKPTEKSTYDKDEADKNKAKNKDRKSSDEDTADDENDGDNKKSKAAGSDNKVLYIALIAGAVIVLVIATELFLYKMAKLKMQNKPKE